MNAKFATKFDAINKPMSAQEFAAGCQSLADTIGVPNPGQRDKAFEDLVEKETGMKFGAAVRWANARLNGYI